MDEQKLIELAKAGDRKALGDLVKKYSQTIYNFAYKICRDKEKAENTMSETFFSMTKSLHQFDGNSKLSTWLYRIVVNHCFMLARSDKSHLFNDPETDEGLFDERYFVDWGALPLKNLENDELRKVLDESIAKLGPEYRIVFMLRDVEGNSTEETADITGLTIAAVKSRLHRARAFLRKEITKAFKR